MCIRDRQYTKAHTFWLPIGQRIIIININLSEIYDRPSRMRPTFRASLSGTFLQRKDVVNQCLEPLLFKAVAPKKRRS